MTAGAFPRDRQLTAIAIGYRNPDATYIADAVFPRVPVGKTTFEYTEYPIAEAYTIPSTRVGERAQVNRVELSGVRKPASTEDFGIEVPLTRNDIDEAPEGVDPRARATEHATNIVLLDREVRAAAIAFNAANYGTANKKTLSGNGQWSNTASDPLKEMLTALDSCIMRPNVLVLGQAVWSALSVHPKLVSAAHGNEGQYGRCTREKLAELLEITEVVVGSAWFNTVKPGKQPALSRAWGKHALLCYRDRTVGTSGGITFGITAQYGDRVAGSREIDIGLRGGVAVRSGESVRELIVAPDAAYFFENAAA